MTKEEIIEVMDKPMRSVYKVQYLEIHMLSTGVPFTRCLCGSGFNQLYKICKNYAEALKKQIPNE